MALFGQLTGFPGHSVAETETYYSHKECNSDVIIYNVEDTIALRSAGQRSKIRADGLNWIAIALCHQFHNIHFHSTT